MQHINTLHFDGDDNFTKNFNTCTAYYLISIDDTRTQEERDKAAKDWFHLRQCMELGINN